jgi:hypothetical protein
MSTSAKDGEEGEVIASELEAINVGIDEDGDPITSCVVIPAEPPTKSLARSTVRQRRRARRAFGWGHCLARIDSRSCPVL